MATTVTVANALYKETIKEVSQDVSHWESFLRTASMNYTNSFSEQLLIYAQRPSAISCADINTWNETYKRLVNRGTPGIGLLTEFNGKPRIRYVWGLNDTHSIYGRKGKKLKVWKVPKVYEEQVIESLENKFGELNNKNNLVDAIKSVAINLTDDNYNDYFNELIENKIDTRLEHIDNDVIERYYKKILENSIAYMIMNRSGIDPTPFFNDTDFIEIPIFQDIESIAILGAAASDIAEMGIREIYVSLKNIRIAEIEKIHTFDKNEIKVYDESEKSKDAERSDNYEHDLHSSGRLYSTESNHERGHELQDGQIRNDEIAVLEREQERNLSSNDNERDSTRTFERDRNISTNKNISNNERDENETQYNGRIEVSQSNEMAWNDEQYQESSRRNSDERTNLQLEDENTENGILFSTDEKYNYKIGDKVSIDTREFEIEDISLFDITLHDLEFPLLSREMNIVEFENKLKENPANDYLKVSEEEKQPILTEKEKDISTTNNETSQLSLFETREKELADRIVDELNSLDTKYKNTFYVDSIKLEKWDHIKSNKRNLSISIKSNLIKKFADRENSFTCFNSDKTDEIVLRECTETNKFLNYLSEDDDFSIMITPDSLTVYYHNFDYKQIDLSVGKDNVLSSINDNDNVEIIDNPKLELPKVEKKPKNRVINYVLHPEIPYDKRINYKIVDDNIGVGQPRERFRNNINAIKTLQQLKNENRYATPEEQEILSKYVGWGGLSQAFKKDGDWATEYNELGNLIGFDSDEYNKAMESVNTAFYTPPIVIKSIYKALENMGLQKGNILEPSCGIGNFIGLLPNNDDLKIYGVELDEISGSIARQLYQKSSIAIKGFENVEYPDSFFDVAIGNVPFGEFPVYDKKYNKHHFLIHDYFFAKTIDKVRPGGVIALITSSGTMDKKSEDVRKYIAARANLLGAIRLPNNTFKDAAGTKVTSDILFLQKRDSITDIMPDWVHLDNSEDGIIMNKYFVDNPNMILGKMENTTHFDMTTCTPFEDKSLSELLDNAISNIHAEIKDYQLDELAEEDKSIEADLNVKNFSYTIVDDKVYYRENSRMYPQELSVTAENRVKGLIELRDETRELINLQLDDMPDEEIIKQQEKLNTLYDNFTKKYGLINNRANASAFNGDNSYYLLCSLEILDENGGLLRKADMFSKRTIMAHKAPKKIESSNDALIVSIGEKAMVDLDYMSEISHKSKDELISDLEGIIFKIPNEDKYVTADEYLSGNIREKIRDAENANESNHLYDINLKYLYEAKPEDLNASEISVRLGTTWIPPEDYEKFMFELFNTDYYSKRKIKINYSDITNEWSIENKSYDRYNEKARTTYGTKRINGYKIFEETLNLRDVKIYDYFEDEEGKKKKVLNGKETAIAQGKQEQIKQAFQDWIWSDPDRRNRLEQRYNELFNAIKPREYDGSNIIFDGINPEISLREHQINAIARILYGGNTLLAHEVGAGKTFEMVAAAMESKRLGLCNKSLFVVPNHIVEQFASEFLQLYPSANILVATKKDFETANRKKFCSRIATGEYDAVIIGHSQFEKIPMSVERQMTLLENEISDIIDAIDEGQMNGASFTVKQLMKTKKQLETKLQRLNDSSRKDDNVVTFEQLGVDRLFVDEAHYYKNLFLYTKMSNVSGIAQTEAQKSSDLYMKCKYLDEITGGKGIVFATGTPISNSMVELYTMQRYLQSNTLYKLGLQNFDAWASTFGETTTAIELAPEGTGYRAKTRFAKFYNLPELISVFKEVADIKTADMLDLPVPKANFENIVVSPSEIQEKMVEELSERAEKIRGGGVDPHEDNMLKITNDGKKLALDQRLINDLLPDEENGKVSTCANNIYKFYKDYDNIKATQLVFCDLSTPKDDEIGRAHV